MNGQYDIVRALLFQLFGFAFDECGKFAARFEIHVTAHTCRNRRIAIPDCADYADFCAVLIDKHRRLTIRRALVRCVFVNVDCQKRKVCEFGIRPYFVRFPVKFVVAESHCRAIHEVEPLGCEFAFGVVGLGASLPHIPRRNQNGIAVCLLVEKISRQLVDARLRVRVGVHTVQVVDCIKVDVNDNALFAKVALSVVVAVDMHAIAVHIAIAFVANKVAVQVVMVAIAARFFIARNEKRDAHRHYKKQRYYRKFFLHMHPHRDISSSRIVYSIYRALYSLIYPI